MFPLNNIMDWLDHYLEELRHEYTSFPIPTPPFSANKKSHAWHVQADGEMEQRVLFEQQVREAREQELESAGDYGGADAGAGLVSLSTSVELVFTLINTSLGELSTSEQEELTTQLTEQIQSTTTGQVAVTLANGSILVRVKVTFPGSESTTEDDAQNIVTEIATYKNNVFDTFKQITGRTDVGISDEVISRVASKQPEIIVISPEPEPEPEPEPYLYPDFNPNHNPNTHPAQIIMTGYDNYLDGIYTGFHEHPEYANLETYQSIDGFPYYFKDGSTDVGLFYSQTSDRWHQHHQAYTDMAHEYNTSSYKLSFNYSKDGTGTNVLGSWNHGGTTSKYYEHFPQRVELTGFDDLDGVYVRNDISYTSYTYHGLYGVPAYTRSTGDDCILFWSHRWRLKRNTVALYIHEINIHPDYSPFELETSLQIEYDMEKQSGGYHTLLGEWDDTGGTISTHYN